MAIVKKDKLNLKKEDTKIKYLLNCGLVVEHYWNKMFVIVNIDHYDRETTGMQLIWRVGETLSLVCKEAGDTFDKWIGGSWGPDYDVKKAFVGKAV
jgi:hypothetical protein